MRDQASETKHFVAEYDVADTEPFFESIRALVAAGENRVMIDRSILSEDHAKAIVVWKVSSPAEFELVDRHQFKGAKLRESWSVFAPPPPPMITRVVPFISQIVPGGSVVAEGQNFGANPGELKLIGSFPAGSLTLSQVSWSDGVVAGVIPNIVGVTDQPALVQVVTAAARASNKVPVSFRADRDIQVIPHPVLKTISFDGIAIASLSTLDVSHLGLLPDYGTDIFACQLKNGWVYHSYVWQSAHGINGTPFDPGPEPSGVPNFMLLISWFYDVFSSAQYQLNVYAIGPTGVPMQ